MVKNLLIAVVAAVTMLFMHACSSPIEVSSKWKNPDVQPYNPSKVLVLVVGQNMEGRQRAEDAFEAALTTRGFNAVGAFDIMPMSSQTTDTAAIRESIKSTGADALLTARAVDVSQEQHWVPGVTTYPPAYYGRWGGYYGYYAPYSSGGYMDETTTALLETNLYDIANTNLLWVGQSSVTVGGNLDKLAAKYAAVVVESMVNDGAIAPN